jgi:transposase
MLATLAKRNEQLEEENISLREAITSLQAKLESTEQERQLLSRLLKNLRGQIYGKTSEKLAPGQQTFDFLGELEQEIEDEQPDDKPKRKPKCRKPDSIPDTVERERINLDVDPELRVCSCCQIEMDCIGEDVTSELEYIPARFVLKQYVRPKYACKTCQDGVLQEALPKRPIKKGLPGVGLLTQVLVAKYVEHQPLYRQEKIYKRQGVKLSRSTLSGWVQAMAKLLLPIWGVLKREVLASSVIQADETPLTVLTQQARS